MTLDFVSVNAAPLVGVSLRLSPGMNVVLGAPADGTAALIGLASGIQAPRAGRVSLSDGNPRRSPELRRRIRAVLETEELIPERSVARSVRAALELSGCATDASAALSAIGLGPWAERRTRDLLPRERRSVALAIALAAENPALVALYEPFADVPGSERRLVRERLLTLAGAGAVVVLATASVRDALELGGSITVLDRGRIVRQLSTLSGSELAPLASVELLVRTGEPRELAAALASDPAVSAVWWNDREAPGQLSVRGAELEPLAGAIVRSARTAGARLIALTAAAPSVPEIRAASAGSARAAYEEAYRVAQERARRAAVEAAPTLPPAPTPETGGAP